MVNGLAYSPLVQLNKIPVEKVDVYKHFENIEITNLIVFEKVLCIINKYVCKRFNINKHHVIIWLYLQKEGE